MQRTRQEIDRAIRQVSADGPVPLPDLAQTAGVTVQTLERWVRHGRDGVFLQAIRKGDGWLSSAQAIGRFVAELARVEEQEGEDLAELRRKGIVPADVAAGAPDVRRPRVQSGAARVTRRPSFPTAGEAGRQCPPARRPS
jgi:hypothetical protein